MNDKNPEQKPAEKSGELMHWFVAVISLVYGCGFLIVFTFFKSYGIDSADFIEAKYIHVGFLYALACLVVIAPIYWLLWPIKGNLPDSVANHIKISLLKRNWKRRRRSMLWLPLGRLLRPQWIENPIHGIHTSWAVRVSIILMMWSFITIVLFADSGFVRNHPKLAIFNFLTPMVVLILGLFGDFFKGGSFTKQQSRVLSKTRKKLRIWWLLVGFCYLLVYFFAPSWREKRLICLPMATFYFGIALIIIAARFLKLFRFPGRVQIDWDTATRLAACQWMMYTIQWAVVVWQTWTFLWTIRPEALSVSLWEILVGPRYMHDIKEHISSADVPFPHRGIYFVFMIVLISFFVMRHMYRLKQILKDKNYEDAKWAANVSVGLIVVALFYMSISSFAHTIYPYIPAEKGGGDFSRSPTVSIYFNTNAVSEGGISINIPSEIISCNATNSLMILDEDDKFIYVAPIASTNDPFDWRIGKSKPRVFEINREAITSIGPTR